MDDVDRIHQPQTFPRDAVQADNLRPLRAGACARYRGALWEVDAVTDTTVTLVAIGR